jgi:hypothetical protein
LVFHSGREADHSSPSSAELYLHSPNTPSWRGAQGEQTISHVVLVSAFAAVWVGGM